MIGDEEYQMIEMKFVSAWRGTSSNRIIIRPTVDLFQTLKLLIMLHCIIPVDTGPLFTNFCIGENI